MAAEIGLLDQVVSGPDELQAAVDDLRREFNRGGPHAVALAKKALLTGDEPSAFAGCFQGPESREGMAAFVEKRKASWMKG